VSWDWILFGLGLEVELGLEVGVGLEVSVVVVVQ